MIISKTKFIDSVAKSENIKSTDLPEVAFVGRSNVGKSSLINYLCSSKNLAKVSSTPGRTRLVNYFLVDDKFYIIDLPGYGFAKGSKQENDDWKNLIEGYFTLSNSLRVVCLLLDIRHEISEKDKQMIKYLYFYHIPFILIATKIDKVPKSQLKAYKQRLATSAKVGIDNILSVSSECKMGKELLLNEIEKYLFSGDENE